VAEAARGATDVSRNVGEAAKAAGGISSDIHGVSDASRATNESASKVHNSAESSTIGKELRKLVAASNRCGRSRDHEHRTLRVLTWTTSDLRAALRRSGRSSGCPCGWFRGSGEGVEFIRHSPPDS
jgi:hypothetical protein